MCIPGGFAPWKLRSANILHLRSAAPSPCGLRPQAPPVPSLSDCDVLSCEHPWEASNDYQLLYYMLHISLHIFSFHTAQFTCCIYPSCFHSLHVALSMSVKCIVSHVSCVISHVSFLSSNVPCRIARFTFHICRCSFACFISHDISIILLCNTIL